MYSLKLIILKLNLLWFSCFLLIIIGRMHCSGIVYTSGVLCDGSTCKCGYSLVICECFQQVQRIVIKRNAIDPGVSNLTINNCNTVQIETSALTNINGLRTVNLNNIKYLQLQTKSFEWLGDDSNDSKLNGARTFYDYPALTITIANTIIPVISKYAFNGRILVINLINNQIQHIDSFAFSNLNGNEKIAFNNCTIERMSVQAFKKFSTQMLLIDNCRVKHNLISRTFSDITVTKLFQIAHQSQFNIVKPSAFIIHQPLKLEISDSSFELFDSECLNVQVAGDVLFRDNVFNEIAPAAFLGITAHRQPKLDFIFANNTIGKLHNHSLDFRNNDFFVKLYTINLNLLCTCDSITNWKSMLYNANDLRVIYCQQQSSQLIKADDYFTKHCSHPNQYKAIIVVIVIVLIVIVVVCILIAYFYRQYKCKKHRKAWINNASPLMQRKTVERTNSMPGETKGSGMKCLNATLPIVQPDGKTYRETVLVFETVDLVTTDF